MIEINSWSQVSDSFTWLDCFEVLRMESGLNLIKKLFVFRILSRQWMLCICGYVLEFELSSYSISVTFHRNVYMCVLKLY